MPVPAVLLARAHERPADAEHLPRHGADGVAVRVALGPEAIVEIAELAVGAERRLGGDVERAAQVGAAALADAVAVGVEAARLSAGGVEARVGN